MEMSSKSIVIIGGSGAVGTEVVMHLLQMKGMSNITSLGRSIIDGIDSESISQYKVDLMDPLTYDNYLSGMETAICTLGVGEPSNVTKEQFERIDKDMVLVFAKACKSAGVKHFELLSSVGTDAKSRSYYLRIKGELINELGLLRFERLSIFQPSMILTPTNRYGFSQGILLAVWPAFSRLLIGGLRKYRGVKVDDLGRSIAENIFRPGGGVEYLDWNNFYPRS